jgi:hypothetical protein
LEEQKRALVTKAYPGNSWAAKVAAMSDSQILAIYFRLKRQGKVV